MISEVAKNEVPETNTANIDNYKDIKPDEKLSVNESKGYWDKEFSSSDEVSDDNGEVYRIGDELVPNNTYEINGYKYETDDNGRIISAEGKLQLKDHEGRLDMDSRSQLDKGDMKDTDDRGHLIADRFNGSGGIENLVPMDRELNQHGDYSSLENTLADAVNDGAKVYLKVEPVYEGNSTRPSEFKVSYEINGEKTVKVFLNGGTNNAQ